MDNVAGGQDISNYFANKYETLYNSVSYNDDDMDILKKKIDAMIVDFDIESDDVCDIHVSVNDVVNGMNHVKRNKKDGLGLLYTDHFINASQMFYILLSLMFSTIICHGFTPDGFNIASIQPLIKDKRKSVNDSSNYRAIALSSPLAKIFDCIILNKNFHKFRTNDLQFGFKPNSSTTKCTFALEETINYFQQNNSDVYVLLLDATKAFDKVNYIKLFQLLIDRGINPYIIKCLLYMYTNQHLNVSWNGCMSKYFSTTNGVKQGGVLSPILFAVYVDELLIRLKNSGYGCMIGHIYCGALGYADDIALIAPSTHALKQMCAICLEYASEYDLEFNPSKSQLIKYGDKEDRPFYFDGAHINYTEKGVHLGHTIGPNIHKHKVKDMILDFKWRVNCVMDNFHFCNTETRYGLFKAYCTSFYGICLWNLQDSSVSSFFTSWRIAMRKVLCLPYRTHCNLLPLIAGCAPVEVQILNRIVKFICSGIKSDNTVLKVLSTLALNGSMSNVSKSCTYIMAKYGLSSSAFHVYSNSLFHQLFQNVYREDLSEDLLANASLIRDVLGSRETVSSGSLLDLGELNFLLYSLCVGN